MPSEPGFDVENTAQKLYGYIKHGDFRNVQETLDPITDRAVVRAIEDRFIGRHTDTDPVNLAIKQREEKIAIYLVEKAFSTDRVHQWPDRSCDQWCYYEHGPDKCKAEFTAVDHSEKENLYKLTKRIKEISQGQRHPGDGLVISTVQHHMVGQQPMEESKSPRYERPMPAYETKSRKTAADEAREKIQKYGRKYVDTNGNTLLHLNIRKPQVYTYVFANGGVPVNIQNKGGDSALHLAVREGLYETAEALVQCSADIALRNFMGQTPIDEAEGPIKKMLEKFQPGVVEAMCGNYRHFERILRILAWASLSSKVKEEKTLMELAIMRSEEDPQVQNCVRILKGYRTSSRLIHAVLCENMDLARDIIEKEKDWKTNIRFMDRTGKTLLSHAVEANNIDLVRLLVDRGGAKVNAIRVRESGMVEETVPLFHKCLKAGLNPEIAKFLNARMDIKERLEKDKNGNTAVLRAIEEDVSPKLVHWLIDTSSGSCLVERNKDGLTPRELALAQKNDPIVKVIDRYISQKPTNIPKYASHLCHERDTLDVVDETTGKTLGEMVQEEKKIKLKFQKFEADAEKISSAAANGDLDELKNLYTANYVDRNGYTVLTRAIVFHKYDICKHLCTVRPELRSIPDNMNRYPLHYAYSLPANVCMKYVCLLLEKNPESIESKVDMMGRCAAEYKDLRETVEIQTMLYDAMTLDVLGKRGPPLGSWPEGAKRTPPDRHVIGHS
ncbi:uncharacterized protein LOC110446964 [Mizuhopecten yessoensis]|uniref:Ankyrin repeat domain-containing protein 53 n=1 Tax=Mizuhopecten yessoensis TaxID=6573 RepID=A0A210QW69_MIZYE|nr:uncharacterized protein LOC110446964 [Mizuhopecten yessoensis]OWF53007.1 Ankyrin repeat domain-containing protein 53 [Mizuhopecten yessoensis]